MSIFTTILLTFFGGVLATCMGALGSVILCAFLAIIGVCAVMAVRQIRESRREPSAVRIIFS